MKKWQLERHYLGKEAHSEKLQPICFRYSGVKQMEERPSSDDGKRNQWGWVPSFDHEDKEREKRQRP